jgi:hypothetical protein
MTLEPDIVELLKFIGYALGLIATGFGGAHINKRRSNQPEPWDESNDPDRRIRNHNHSDNGKVKFVPQTECELRHENVETKLDNIAEVNQEIKRDIRSINKNLGGA